MNNQNNDLCTICLESNNNSIILPCNCTNPVHINCIIKWILVKKKMTCEICKKEYNISNEHFINYFESNSIEDIIIPDYEDNSQYDRNIYEQLVNERNIHINNQNQKHILICFIIISLWLLFVFTD